MNLSLDNVKSQFDPGQVWVIKIGSSLLTHNGQELAKDWIANWAAQIAELHHSGISVVLVSSGAVAAGMNRLGMRSRPKSLQLLQAAAAVGQMGLVQAYESEFQHYQLHTAQVLLTHEDLRSRERYLNARGTLKSLLALGVIPIVNENDTVVTDEIRLGDNDTLAALVVNLIEANTLLLLTDQLGLFNADPRYHPSATLIETSKARNPALDQMAGIGSTIGRGGMATKIKAARIAARSGAHTLIASGIVPQVMAKLLAGEISGTLLLADQAPLVSRKQWLASLPEQGKLYLDPGAVRVLQSDGRSLLAVGVTKVEGQFTRGEMVSCVDSMGAEIARGLSNYNHQEASALCGRPSQQIAAVVGYVGDEELIHRDNLIIV